MNMSFLKEQYESLEGFIKKQQDEIYEKTDILKKKLFNLINEVREKLPDDVEETLYDGMYPPSLPQKRSFKFSLSKKEGIKHLEKYEYIEEGIRPILDVVTISVEDFVFHVDFDYKEACENLQRIIDKYKLEINLKNYT